jgi:hypothetical protein
LFIYSFYRTEKTLINQLFILLFSWEGYLLAKTIVVSILPLNDYIIFSLPEGLWVFCITITSSFFYLNIWGRKWSLVVVPMLLAVTMEIFQLLHLAHGRFDIMDILFSFIFWLLALLYTRRDACPELLFKSINMKTVYCMTSYLIVFLAHVNY